MSQTAFLLVVFSAVMHALWNLLVKRSRHKTVFIWWMFFLSSVLFTMILPLTPDALQLPSTGTLSFAVTGAFCFVLYHLYNGRAYRDGDLSIVYPLSQTAIIYVPVWGILFLGERLKPAGVAGILLVTAGTYALQMRRFTFDELLRPFKSLRSSSVRDALIAGFVYSIGSIAEKCGVRDYPPLTFTYILVLIMFCLMTVNMVRGRYRSLIMTELKENRWLIIISGPVIMASFLSFRYGLSLSNVSYAVPARQISIVFGVLTGVIFLKEPCAKARLVSAGIILTGALLIRFG